ncbi:MAG: hypothetical protein ABI333_08500 [bacterium]
MSNEHIAETLLSPGEVVGGRYRIIQHVAEGPLDQLYEAQDVDLHQRVILRMIRGGLATQTTRVRPFEEQARRLRPTGPKNSVRILELGRDPEHGHFAAISNPDSKTAGEMLAMLDGVDGAQSPPPARTLPKDEPDDPPWRFPSTQSQVELDTLAPPPQPSVPPREPPRYAEPRRPKRLETLELEPTAKPVRRPGAPSFPRETRGGRFVRRVPLLLVVALLVGGVATGLLYFRSNRSKAKEEPPETEVSGPVVSAPAREVQIIFRVRPQNARMLINGKAALGHSFLAPESQKPVMVRFVARGYRAEELAVVPERSRTILVILKKKKK